MKFRILEFR